jgi:hypothetical protein
MTIVPITLREANEFVEAFHRHNGRTTRDGGKFAIGLDHDGDLVGVAIVGNPLPACFMGEFTAEVLRLCTNDLAPKGSCSKLYAACWRIWQAMGGQKLITYTLQSESGASLRGAGWLRHRSWPAAAGRQPMDAESQLLADKDAEIARLINHLLEGDGIMREVLASDEKQRTLITELCDAIPIQFMTPELDRIVNRAREATR